MSKRYTGYHDKQGEDIYEGDFCVGLTDRLIDGFSYERGVVVRERVYFNDIKKHKYCFRWKGHLVKNVAKNILKIEATEKEKKGLLKEARNFWNGWRKTGSLDIDVNIIIKG